MFYEVDDYFFWYFQISGIDLVWKVDELVVFVVFGDSFNFVFYCEMFFIVMCMVQVDCNCWDVKIMLQILCEMEYVFSVFEQFKW